jgi:hypothetical protein
MSAPETHVESTSQTGAGCLVRLAWMAFGNLALAICLVFIAQHTGRLFSASDAVFWAIIPVLIYLRYLDVTRMKGQTAAGEPASLRDWKRYVALLLIICLVTWIAAHGFAWLRGR